MRIDDEVDEASRIRLAHSYNKFFIRTIWEVESSLADLVNCQWGLWLWLEDKIVIGQPRQQDMEDLAGLVLGDILKPPH